METKFIWEQKKAKKSDIPLIKRNLCADHFDSLRSPILEFEEYGLNDAPRNSYHFYIDIGARIVPDSGDLTINEIAIRNPRTACIGYEPDLFHYRVLKEYYAYRISNLKVFRKGIGYSSPEDYDTLEQIFKRYRIRPEHNTAMKIDCEGVEYDIIEKELHILKNIDHLAFEFHTKKTTPNEYLIKNHEKLADSVEEIENILEEKFLGTHTIYATGDYSKDARTYVLKNNTVSDSLKEGFTTTGSIRSRRTNRASGTSKTGFATAGITQKQNIEKRRRNSKI